MSARSVVQLMKHCDGQIGSKTHQMLLDSVARKVTVLEDLHGGDGLRAAQAAQRTAQAESAAAKAEAEALHSRCAAAQAVLVCQRRRAVELTPKASEAIKLLASVVGPRPEELVAGGD